jgi:hypothetical protein
MRTNQRGRAGAALLIIGGALESAALGMGSITSPPSTTVLGAALLSVYAGAWLLTGAGLIATGSSLPGRGRTAVKIAGVLACIAGIVEAVQFVIGTPFGPAPTFATYFAYIMAVVVAGSRLLSDRTLRRAVRWSIAVPAVCLVLSIAGDYVPLLGALLSLPGVVALPWVGTVFAGLLLIRRVGQPTSVATRFA